MTEFKTVIANLRKDIADLKTKLNEEKFFANNIFARSAATE